MLTPLKSIASLFVMAALSVATVASAQDRRPLILDGTETIFERVLTRPGAVEHSAQDGPAVGQYPAFQPLYVYGRAGDWLEVGQSASRGPDAWVQAADTVLWKQNIVGAFTNNAGRSRQLLFEEEDDLLWLLNHEDIRAIQERLVAEASAGTIDGARGVVTVEPQEFVNIRERLYVMPILDYSETLHPLSYSEMLHLEVASVPQTSGGQQEIVMVSDDPFDVGIVFLLDTTQSMEAYISLTQRVLQNTVREITGTEIGDLVNFGAIGFRDNPDAVQGLGYRTKTLIGLERRTDETPVIDAIGAAVEVATVSSPGFNEDSLAAVEDAIDTIDWDQVQTGDDPINARYVILITDAGPKGPGDANARSAIGAAELQADAEEKGVVVMTLHLKTDAGQGNHAYAAGEYRALSRFAGNEYYFPIERGSEDAFAATAGRLVTALTDHVRVARGEDTLLSDGEVDEDLVELGRAMQLAWLGSRGQGTAPDIITGWVSNLAAEAPERLAIEPRLLVTKNEMATMASLLRGMVEFAEDAQSSGELMSFFSQVRGLMADLAQNPDRLINAEADGFGGALEFLDRLPYKSQVLGMTEQRFAEGAMKRRQFIDGMRQKLTQYEKWLFDSSVWTALYDGAPDGEYVFAMPFDVLP